MPLPLDQTKPNMKDPINICFEPEAQECGMSFKSILLDKNTLE